MTFDSRKIVLNSRSLVLGLSCAVLLLIAALIPLDGRPHGEWMQFLGRFHSLVVHLPIGFILLVALLEISGRTRPALREAAGVVLWLSVPACFAATILGILLAYGNGDAGLRVTRHMWGGIVLTVAVCLCAQLRSQFRTRWAYPAMLACVVGILIWATHEGGSITHGDGYLTEHAPSALKQLPAMFQPREIQIAAPSSFYAIQVQPILDAKCVSCHGASKVKGRLRLDSYDRLLRGGQDGQVIAAGNAERSLLFQRIMLPMSDKKFMPSDGKPPLNPAEIAIIKAWIQDGASPTAPTVKVSDTGK